MPDVEPEAELDRTQFDDSHRVRLLIVLASVGLFSFAAGAGLFWINLRANVPLEQPLTVTACIPETYDAPRPFEKGPPQSKCDRWFNEPSSDPADTWFTSEPITVVGQVCNTSEDPVGYTVEVAFESVLAQLESPTGTRVLVIDTPITYDPGCQPPYRFDFYVPRLFGDLDNSDGSLGRWRLVGRATPVDGSRYATYQWDVTSTFNLVRSSDE